MRYFIILFILAALAVLAVAGLRLDHGGSPSRKPPIELFPDMDRQPKLRPQTSTSFVGWEDGLSSRPFVAGTVARGSHYEENEFTTGRQPGTTNFVAVLPVRLTETLMQRGRHEFNIYCAPCHGQQGDGKGVTSKLGMAAVANLHDARIVNLADGDLFNTITHGKNLMGGYAANIDIEDRWAVIAYLRALQRSRLATVDDVPEFARENLK
jgi:mono/diheme cytochrome c family protein